MPKKKPKRPESPADPTGHTPESTPESSAAPKNLATGPAAELSDAELSAELARRLPRWYAEHQREQMRSSEERRSEEPTALSRFARQFNQASGEARRSRAILIARGEEIGRMTTRPDAALSALAGAAHDLDRYIYGELALPHFSVATSSSRKAPTRAELLLMARGAGAEGRWVFGPYGTRQVRERAMKAAPALLEKIREHVYLHTLVILGRGVKYNGTTFTFPQKQKDQKLINGARKLTNKLRRDWEKVGGPTANQPARPGWEAAWEVRRSEATTELLALLGRSSKEISLLGGDLEASLVLLNLMGRMGLSTPEDYTEVLGEIEELRLKAWNSEWPSRQQQDDPRQVTRRLWVRPEWNSTAWHLSATATLTIRGS